MTRGAAVVWAVACHAGTKKPGSVTGPEDEAVMARPNAFPRLGVNMAAIGVDMAVVGVLRCWLHDRGSQTIGAQLFVLSHTITCCRNSTTERSGQAWSDHRHSTLPLEHLQYSTFNSSDTGSRFAVIWDFRIGTTSTSEFYLTRTSVVYCHF